MKMHRLVVALLLAAAFAPAVPARDLLPAAGPQAVRWWSLPGGGDPVAVAFQAHRSHVQLTVKARVKRILPDDRRGIRHQRFLIQTEAGISVLVAHNIDLAPRLAGLEPGEQLVLCGEYIWNPKGGLLHWTHHDPSGRHNGGYIERQGHRYE